MKPVLVTADLKSEIVSWEEGGSQDDMLGRHKSNSYVSITIREEVAP